MQPVAASQPPTLDSIVRVDRAFPVDTAQRIAQLVAQDAEHLPLIQKARELVATVSSENQGSGWKTVAPLARMGRILQWVREHVTYVPDPVRLELVKAPRHLLREIETHPHGKTAEDCDSIVALVAALQQAVGIVSRVKLVSLRPRPPEQWKHVVAEGYIPQLGWILSDATLNDDDGRALPDRINAERIAEIPR